MCDNEPKLIMLLNDQGGAVMNVEDGTVSPCLRECAARAHEPILVFKADGDGGGGIVPTLVGDHENRVTDHTALVVGVDMYNQCTTGGVAHMIRSKSADNDHIPCVICEDSVIGADMYNIETTGGGARTLTADRVDNEHIPCVIYNSSGGGISMTIDSHYYLGQGCRGGKEREFVVIPIEGNGVRDSHKGNGYGVANDPMFTLNNVEQHGVAYEYKDSD